MAKAKQKASSTTSTRTTATRAPRVSPPVQHSGSLRIPEWYQEVQRSLHRIERKLGIIKQTESQIMSIEQDDLTAIQGLSDSFDTIGAAYTALAAAQAAGNQAAIDKEMANIKTALDGAGTHRDAVTTIIGGGAPAPTPAPTPNPNPAPGPTPAAAHRKH